MPPAQLDDLVLAADRVGAAVQDVGGGHAAGEVAVDADVVGSSTSAMPTIELTVVPPSLIASFAMCEWQSMIPGVMYLPVTSITCAPAGNRHVGADGGDLAVADQDRRVRQDAFRDGVNRPAAQRDDAGLLCLAVHAGDRGEPECCREGERQKGNGSASHDILQGEDHVQAMEELFTAVLKDESLSRR